MHLTSNLIYTLHGDCSESVYGCGVVCIYSFLLSVVMTQWVQTTEAATVEKRCNVPTVFKDTIVLKISLKYINSIVK